MKATRIGVYLMLSLQLPVVGVSADGRFWHVYAASWRCSMKWRDRYKCLAAAVLDVSPVAAVAVLDMPPTVSGCTADGS